MGGYTYHAALGILWGKLMEEPQPCHCGKRAVFKDYPGSEHSPTFGGPWAWTPAFYCKSHAPYVVGRVGNDIQKKRQTR